MSSNAISTNAESVSNVISKLTTLQEETEEHLKALERALVEAEADGWNDAMYSEFFDKYLEFSSTIKGEIRRIEEEHLPYLRRLLRSIEDFMDE